MKLVKTKVERPLTEEEKRLAMIWAFDITYEPNEKKNGKP